MTPGARRALAYERVAWLYDAAATAYSLGAIDRAKRATVAGIPAGARVLFAGIGTGADAVLARARGARVIGFDVSARMLARARRRFAARGLDGDFVRGELEALAPEARFDVVVASFFLNISGADAVAAEVARLRARVRPGGWLWIADFAPPPPGLAGRALHASYYWPLAWVGWALGLCALHAVHDYRALAARTGPMECATRDFHVAGIPWPLYRTWSFRLPAGGEAGEGLAG